ncbi:hypothetical protein [Tannerella forsythia]|uniref:tetratricopeptide repeat protein n=1 Tax=Tannerella forsythia TaxID=28112 RepID=UPI0028E8CADB|nr:hypothetical protein [Tannerella forsythia]
MKMKGILVVAGLWVAVAGAYAQKGVDNGTRYGSGEDSIRCLTNISLFVPYAKVNNYQDAYSSWKIAYEECPAATKDIYLYGVRIVNWQIEQEKDATKRDALINDLMAVYDKRIQYFGNDGKYGKDWITARKTQDYLRLKGEQADIPMVYGWLSRILDEYKEKTDELALSQYMFASHKMMEKDEAGHKAKFVQDFVTVSSIFDSQIKAAQAAGNQKLVDNLTAMKAGMEKGFSGSGAADCETLQNIYADQIEANKDNLDFLKETITLMRRAGCQEIDAYFAASEYAYQKEKTAEIAWGMGKQSVKKKDYDAAERYFNEAAEMATDNEMKENVFFTLAAIAFEQRSYQKMRNFCNKTLSINPNNGKAYIMIGKAYAATASSIFPDDPVKKKCVYYAAVDKFQKARSVDPSVASEASSLIATYSSYFPTTEEVFMHPDLNKGQSFMIGGWIGEQTTVR